MANPCGKNSALAEAQAATDDLKKKIKGGLDSLTDIGGLADTIKKKMAEANVKPPKKLSLQEELDALAGVTDPREYDRRVAELRRVFGSSVENLEELIAQIPRPVGAGGGLLNRLNNIIDDAQAAVKKAQNDLLKIGGNKTVICEDAPNVESEYETDENGDVVTGPDGYPIMKPPTEKPPAPVSPNSNPTRETKPSDPPSKQFTFAFTQPKLRQATTAKASEWYNALNSILPKYGITTPERVACFLGQISHESGIDLSRLVEGGAYKAPAYFKICAKRLGLVSESDCAPYLTSPEKVFQGLYESTLDGKFHYMGYQLHGKGSIQRGDGAKFRGRGLIQLTGRLNYTRASKEIYGDDRLVKNPELVATDKNVAIETSCWFWKARNINSAADRMDIVEVTRKVNGGTIGLDDRVKLTNKAYGVLKG